MQQKYKNIWRWHELNNEENRRAILQTFEHCEKSKRKQNLIYTSLSYSNIQIKAWARCLPNPLDPGREWYGPISRKVCDPD